ncbi:hypothetical protein C8Q74DRAFT_1265021 [Fomes fomentarius]|nr:hypothetical protein C8Q74DRAFT_1265021 [Fomes fomentarius]
MDHYAHLLRSLGLVPQGLPDSTIVGGDGPDSSDSEFTLSDAVLMEVEANLPVLPFDILHTIQSVADQQSLSRMMKTCRSLYESGEKIILRNVCLSSGKKIEFFARYMVVEGADRLRLLHALNLMSSSPGQDALRVLFLRLRLYSNFTSLTLHNPEGLLEGSRGLAIAIAALTSLKVLTILDTGPHTLNLLRSMRSPLIRVRISTRNAATREWEDRYDITQILPCSRSTLQEIRASWPARPARIPGVQGSRYPQLRSLVLDIPYTPTTLDYVRAYPRLSFLAIYGMDDDLPLPDGGHYDAVRQANREQQETSGSWLGLRTFQGSIRILFVLGLTCRVPRIIVDNFDHESNGPILHAVLIDTNPARLDLRVLGANSFRRVYAPVLKDSPAGALTSVALTIRLMCHDVEMSIDAFLRTVRGIVKALFVTTFELRIDCSRMAVRTRCSHHNLPHCPADAYRRSSAHYRFPVETQLEALDLPRVARRIKKAAPCVQTVVVRITNLHLQKDAIVIVGDPIRHSHAGVREEWEHELEEEVSLDDR